MTHLDVKEGRNMWERVDKSHFNGLYYVYKGIVLFVRKDLHNITIKRGESCRVSTLLGIVVLHITQQQVFLEQDITQD
jgi:hypothetical protein